MHHGEEKPPLFIIAGATASGKSSLALSLTKSIGGEIISADSMQVYRGMEIGTAQPSPEDRKAVAHHCTGHVDPSVEYDVFRFVEEAEAILQSNHQKKIPTIVCGGTGLFLRQLAMGIFDGAPKDEALRSHLETYYDEIGEVDFRAELRSIDPDREKQIFPNDKFRLVRALEVYRSTGVPMSEQHRRHQAELAERRIVYNIISRHKDQLEIRIRSRIEIMMESGWIEETRKLSELNLPSNSQAMKALGYKQIIEHLAGKRNLEETIDEIHLRTRQFAKRQRTLFRGVANQKDYANVIDLDSESMEQAGELLLKLYEEKIGQPGN